MAKKDKPSVLDDLSSRARTVASDLLESTDFLSRTIGMSNSYETLMYIVQALGHEPVSLLGHDFPFIFDHVRRNYRQGMVENGEYDTTCPRFTFYKKEDVPTIRFADPYNDHLGWLERWEPTMEFTKSCMINGHKTFAESHDGMENQNREVLVTVPDGTATYMYESIREDGKCDLLAKTNRNFRRGRYQTLIARFYTNTAESRDPSDPTQSAVSGIYGMSHGRNLLKLNPTDSYGYKNPYCRVWTYHHEYLRISDLIRPFGEGQPKDGMNGTASFRTFQHNFYGFGQNGRNLLWNNGVLNYENGHVRIAPTAKIKNYFDGSGYDDGTRQVYSPKNCMFSIENLAWKNTDMDKTTFDAYGLSAEQKGPLGGRIMWFPPYNLKFSESVDVKWNPNEFIGRGEALYTYTNTQRNGNLSFTILIDHPSILDYLKKDSNGDIADPGANGSHTAPEGYTAGKDGVDDLGSAEQTILRFFAGCDVLTAEPQKYYFRSGQRPNVGTEETPVPSPNPDENKPEEKPASHKLVCFLYYPNNYSGVDDAPTKTGKKVNAVDYLMNGVGAQKVYDEFTESAVDYRVDPNQGLYAGTSGGGVYGGYEMRSPGISIVTEADTTNKQPYKPEVSRLKNVVGAINVSLSVKQSPDVYPIMIGNDPIMVRYGSSTTDEYMLCKQVGRYPNYAKKKNAVNGTPWYCKWYYRVDGRYVNDILNSGNSYVDTDCFGLNQKIGYNKVTEVHGGTDKVFGIDITSNNTTLVSFSDLYEALMGDSVKNGATAGDKADSVNVATVKDILTNKSKYRIAKMSFVGNASAQGYVEENKLLSKNRAETFRNWVGSKGIEAAYSAFTETNLQDPNKDNPDVGNNSKLQTKLWRSAMMVVEYDMVEVEDANTTDPSANVETVGEDASATSPRVNLNTGTFSESGFENMTLDQKLEYLKNYPNPDILQAYGEDIINQIETDWEDSPGEHTGTSTVKRYDNEGEFFREIDSSDNFLRHKIKDKIKYFDPAFHSVSPEGFSARLTFLHQCTRQSSTVSNSAWESSTAYNLAFGRPPVCVLRVGDFYYTKIIISSVNIDYEDIQWDLNPEGAGVIPMFANVTINFHFIGGSDLGGPIARLQNAVSFNYYANTSAYDNRAEMVKYDESGNGKEVAFKPFVFPNHTNRKIGSGGDYGSIRSKVEVNKDKFYKTGDVEIDESKLNVYNNNDDGMWSDL